MLLYDVVVTCYKHAVLKVTSAPVTHDVTRECPRGVKKLTTQNLASHAIVYLN